MRLLLACVMPVLFLSGNARAAEWLGHLAKLSDARLACRNIDSRQCKPYMAQAVAVADVVSELTHAEKVHGDYKMFMPYKGGSSWQCKDGFLSNLNGENLVHLTLAVESKDSPFYWDDALLIAAWHLCQTSPDSN